MKAVEKRQKVIARVSYQTFTGDHAYNSLVPECCQ